MSSFRRGYDILRAYIGREWERIETITESKAREELNSYLNHSTPPPIPVEKKNDLSGPLSEADALKILNLSRDSNAEDLKRAYSRLINRSKPDNFPEGSEERKQAARVHLRVQEAYDLLLPKLDQTHQRFTNLDID